MPLGTRGGTRVRHTFPADGEYVFSGRLVRGVEEGLFGVEGHDRPHEFLIIVDGKTVFSARGRRRRAPRAQRRGRHQRRAGPRRRDDDVAADPDHGRPARRRLHVDRACGARAKRLGARSARLARGPQSFGHAASRGRRRRGPVQRHGRQRHAEHASASSSAGPRLRPRSRRAPNRSCRTLARRAFRRPVDGDGHRGVARVLRRCACRRRRLRRRHSRRPSSRMLVSPWFLFRVEARFAGRAGRLEPSRSATLELASRLSFFLWSSIPDDELLDARRERRAARGRACSKRRCGA